MKKLVRKVKGPGLARDSMWGMGLEAISVVSTIVVFSLIGRSFGPTEYGAYVSVFALVNPMVTLTASGVSLALMEHAVRRQEPLDEVARSSLTTTLVLGALLSVVGVLLALNLVEEISPLAAITIVISEFMVSPLTATAAATLASNFLYRDALKVRLLTTVARTLVVVSLYAMGRLTVTMYVLTNVIVLLLVSIVVLRAVGRKLGFPYVPGRFRVPLLKTNGTYSVAISAHSFQNDGEKMVMTANNLTTDTGLYTVAYRMVLMGMVPIGAVLGASHARILEQVEGQRGHHLRLSVKFGAILGAYGLVASIAAFFAAPLVPVLVGDEFQESVEMMRWLAPLIFLRAIGAPPENGLLGLGRNGMRTILVVLVAVVSVVLYVTMIPVWGWQGAIVATMIAESLLVIVSWVALWIFQRRHDRGLEARVPTPDTSVEILP